MPAGRSAPPQLMDRVIDGVCLRRTGYFMAGPQAKRTDACVRTAMQTTRMSFMIRHFVFFTAKSDGNVEAIRQGLQLLTRIPDALHLEIALNRKSDPMSKEVDVVVYGEFKDDAALAAYKAHALYAEAIKRVRHLRELRFAADYDVATAVSCANNQL